MTPIAKVIVLTKNEYDMIEDFLIYYGYLFGYENIVIVDNASDHQIVLDVYEKYSKFGVKVITEKRSFDQATVFMTEHIQQVIQDSPCEWLILLETDEFLFWTPTALQQDSVVRKEDVHNFLKSVPSIVTYLRYDKFYHNTVDKQSDGYVNGAYTRPARQAYGFCDQDWDKIIVRSSAFHEITQWPHHADVSFGNRQRCYELGLLHFHYPGKRRQFEKACQVLESIGVCNDIAKKFKEDPFAVFDIITMYANAGASHGHKAGYVADVLMRSLCWSLFGFSFGRSPSLHELNMLLKDCSSTNTLYNEMAKLRHSPTNVSTDTYEDCVYVEDQTVPTFLIHQVKNTFARMEELQIPQAQE